MKGCSKEVIVERDLNGKTDKKKKNKYSEGL